MLASNRDEELPKTPSPTRFKVLVPVSNVTVCRIIAGGDSQSHVQIHYLVHASGSSIVSCIFPVNEMANFWLLAASGNGSNCSELSPEQLRTLSILKRVLLLLSCLPCAMVVLLIVCLRAYRSFIYRLAVYLTLAAIFYSLTTALQMVPGDLFHVYNSAFCKAVGFLAEYGSWVLLLYIYWVIVQLFLLSVCHASTKKLEPILVFLPIVIPLSFVWIPFIHGLYGPAGGWCWIMTATADCHKIKEGQIEQFVLWYGPMFVASAGSIVVTVTTVAVLCKGVRGGARGEEAENPLRGQYQRALREALPLLIYSILFSLFDWVAIASRVYYALADQVNYPLWLVHAVGDACRGLFVPLAFLFHPNLLKRLSCKALKARVRRWQSTYTTTFFVVSKEHSDQSETLVIRGRGAPHTDTGYQSFQSWENNLVL